MCHVSYRLHKQQYIQVLLTQDPFSFPFSSFFYASLLYCPCPCVEKHERNMWKIFTAQ